MAQSEAQLEESLIKRLGGLGYERVTIRTEDELLANLKTQLEKHNDVTLTDAEFAKILNHLDKGNVFDKAETLRDRLPLIREDGDTIWIEFMNQTEWCQNQYQVTNQISMDGGTYKNRYDVTLLVNGLPLVQIELKRRGLELKEAFNQINRYQRHSFWSGTGLFQYVQIFVISNGVNTKYYANNRKQSFKQTFFWAKEDNSIITQLDAFADAFLEKCHVSKMIAKYTVLHQSDKILMVLRPYQYYAVEALIDRVKTSDKNGYVWHTTGSGKTLTSFKASQILMDLPETEKVVFVVDRADLDYQTTKEFNHFSDGSVDGTDNTKALVKQFGDPKRSLIVTTIQKLNTAISKASYLKTMEGLADKRVVFIFDECHRSQFGDTHLRITKFFKNYQMFGFTGTPIFEDNALKNEKGKRTTKDLFGERLHRYVITDAIRDQNVLKFSVEYWGKLVGKDGNLINDEQVAAIDKKEFFENPDRIGSVTDWIIQNHDRKTHNRKFSAIFAVGSVDALIQYYDAFKARHDAGETDLRVATIFTFGANEADDDANGMIEDPDEITPPSGSDSQSKDKREKLDSYIADYNALYGTKHSAKDGSAFYTYYKALSKRLKDREKENAKAADRLDILLVVNMFLTGFDAKMVNTLYVDKNLRYHGLVQAYSRTNRILNEVKSQGNIICFRNLKDNTDEAIRLFSNKDASETIFIEPYDNQVEAFNEAVTWLRGIAPTVNSVNNLEDEKAILAFVKAFRNLMRIKNVLTSFVEFEWGDLAMGEQEFADYASKYHDIREQVKTAAEDDPVSIVDEVDFELELIRRDEINVAYILELLRQIQQEEINGAPAANSEQRRQEVLDMIGKEPQLRSKRDLIEKFIRENMPEMAQSDDMSTVFDAYWSKERDTAIDVLCAEEGLDKAKFEEMIGVYHYSSRLPLRDTVIGALKEKPKLMERKGIIERVTDKLIDLIRTFDEDIGDV
ncbi:type I restriction endonuclease subunit R [Parasphingorhabdus sp. DH2-15]|uniref:type I restriction endonuclease subunit R n=1 Tax=Parasphingorhabdus sp. DH2-15 TaxID=3444112 RepID=UPI003F687882